MPSATHLGDNLRWLRMLRKQPQDVVAGVMQVARSTYSAWETRSTEPRMDQLVRLSDYYGVSYDWLLRKDLVHVPLFVLEQHQRAHKAA